MARAGPATVSRAPAANADRRVGWRLRAESVTKRFGPLTVLDDVSLSVAAGEAVALVGETGAGKSTLVGCIGRIGEADAGEILLDGARMPGNPGDVRRAGVEVVWQEDGLCHDLDVLANLLLGREPRLLRCTRPGTTRRWRSCAASAWTPCPSTAPSGRCRAGSAN